MILAPQVYNGSQKGKWTLLTLYTVCCARSLKENDKGISMFSDTHFNRFSKILDSYIGLYTEKHGIIMEDIEDRLWDIGLLSDGSPQVLHILLYWALFCWWGKDVNLSKLCCMRQSHVQATWFILKLFASWSISQEGDILDNPKRCLVWLFKKYTLVMALTVHLSQATKMSKRRSMVSETCHWSQHPIATLM